MFVGGGWGNYGCNRNWGCNNHPFWGGALKAAGIATGAGLLLGGLGMMCNPMMMGMGMMNPMMMMGGMGMMNPMMMGGMGMMNPMMMGGMGMFGMGGGWGGGWGQMMPGGMFSPANMAVMNHFNAGQMMTNMMWGNAMRGPMWM